MTLEDLKRLVALGEGTRLEFKNRVPRPSRIAREVIALANTDGGTVLIGVDDDGTIVGLKDVEEEAFALQAALDDLVEPTIDVSVEWVRISRRREVLVVRVPPSPERPHYLRPTLAEGDPALPNGSAKRSAFVRVDDASVEASREAVALMKAERRGDSVLFTFGDSERRLLEFLDRHEKITVREYGRMARVPPWRASKTLVTLVRAGILTLHAQAGGADYFTASSNGHA